ncbi:hypothetical protein NIA69_03655 [Gemmiger formicilis]|nr:hypothetical protein [Gemmiger formicilis]
MFEGVYQNAVVYLNGEKLPNTVTAIRNLPLMPPESACRENTLRVTVDNSLEPNCRWYTGSGIYRPVHLMVKPKDGVRPVKIRTVSIAPAVVEVQTETEHAAVEIWDGAQCVAKGAPGASRSRRLSCGMPNTRTCTPAWSRPKTTRNPSRSASAH